MINNPCEIVLDSARPFGYSAQALVKTARRAPKARKHAPAATRRP